MKTTSRKGSAGIIIIVVIVIILLVLGAYYLDTHNVSSNQAPASTTTSTPTAPTDPYAGWQTYQNTTIGFQLKYPPIFTKPPTEISQDSIFDATFFAPTPTTTTKTVPGETLVISVTPQTASQNVQSDIQNYEAGNNLGSPSDCITGVQVATTTIQGEAAVKVSCSNANAGLVSGTLGSTATYDFYHNHQHYIIGLSGDTSGNDVMGQIMESFSFTQ